MAGDKFNVTVNSWWEDVSKEFSAPENPVNQLIAAMSSSIAGVTGGHPGAGDLQNSGTFINSLTSFLNGQSTNSSIAKGYLNWILLDNNFNYVSSNSGYEQIGESEVYTTHTRTNMPITKSGYLYIYVSNATPDRDVFFDNLQVSHIRGQMLEETHYYPFGLTMAGISSKALNGIAENKKKYQGYEFNSDFDLNLYESFYRTHDPQLGRFWQIDPKPYFPESPYVAMGNNPIKNIDILGDELGGTDRESAKRQEEIIKNSAKGKDGDAFRKLVKLKKDGMTFKKISQKKLDKAVSQIQDADQKGLAQTYGKAINSNDQMFVRVVNRGENPDIENKKMSKEWSTNPNSYVGRIGNVVDDRKGGGVTEFMDGQSVSTIVMNSTFQTAYENKSTGETVMGVSSAGETAAHEILGHALGKFRESATYENQDAIRMSNLFRRSTGDNTLFRTGAVHPPGNIRMTSEEANQVPDYLKW